jgi:hypothetical protein
MRRANSAQLFDCGLEFSSSERTNLQQRRTGSVCYFICIASFAWYAHVVSSHRCRAFQIRANLRMAAVLGYKSLPEMVFGHNELEIQHSDFMLRICAADALKVAPVFLHNCFCVTRNSHPHSSSVSVQMIIMQLCSLNETSGPLVQVAHAAKWATMCVFRVFHCAIYILTSSTDSSCMPATIMQQPSRCPITGLDARLDILLCLFRHC